MVVVEQFNNSDYSLFVSSEGICQSCDVIIEALDDVSKQIEENDIVYVKAVLMRNDNIREKLLKTKIVLVTGHNDETIPDDIFQSFNEFQNFIGNSNILHWFAQNCAIPESNKITKIPIGVDYHTLEKHSKPEWGDSVEAKKQEQILLIISESSKPFYEKTRFQCYNNFSHSSYGNKFGYDRNDILPLISPELVYTESTFLKREETWKKQSDFVFVLSPHGNGLDCHRTWESLILKNIVIVKTSPLDCLYENLPVWIINDWSDVTMESMNDIKNKFSKTIFDYSKLYLNYWTNKFHNIRK